MRKLLPFVLLLMLNFGCHTKLNQESTVSLTNIEAKHFLIKPISKEQVINVSAKSTEGTFNVFVFLEKDKNEAVAAIEKTKLDDSKVLNHKLKTPEAELQATIPANETAIVYLVSADGKKAEVKLKISN